MGYYRPTTEDGRRTLAEGWQIEQQAALPITTWDVSMSSPAVAKVSVDASQHPEITDLSRVHRLEGPMGDVHVFWEVGNEAGPFWTPEDKELPRMLIATWRITKPVRTSFHLVFRFPEHVELLKAADARGI